MDVVKRSRHQYRINRRVNNIAMSSKVYIAADPIDRSKTIFNDIVDWMHVVIGFIGIFVYGIVKSIGHTLKPAKLKSIENQVALVTGGGNGLGRSIGIELAKHGCHVAIADVDQFGAESTAKEIRKIGVKSMAYKIDVSDYEQVRRLRDSIEQDIGPVDILINNAGILTNISLLEGKPEEIQRVINVNLTAHLWTCRLFINGMNERGRGHIVAISSVLGCEGAARAICYCATKFGVRGMMEALREELRSSNSPVATTTVFPAVINTRKEFIDKFLVSVSMQFQALLPLYTPEEIARGTVDGLRANKRDVFFNYLHEMLPKIAVFFPVRLQDTLRDYIKPCVSQSFMADIIES